MDIQQQPDESPMDFLARQAQEMGLYNEEQKPSWDNLFEKLERKLDIYIPIRAKNWVRNKYNPPTEKK